MDNPTRWNITNSAQNIVSALVDPTKQYDNVFRREWVNTFASFSKQKPGATYTKFESDLKSRLQDYVARLERRGSMGPDGPISDTTVEQTSRSTTGLNVPDIFMQEKFDLSESSTFAQVMALGSSNLSPQSSNDQSKSSSIIQFGDYETQMFTNSQLKDVQQRLTDYLDVIEEHLASRISSRSGDFFQVMSSVDSVMDELSLAIRSVTQLRHKCARLNSNVMAPNMKSIELSRIRDNAQSVIDQLDGISQLCKVQPMIQTLLSASDIVGALDLISKSRVKLHKDLTRVISLRYMESQLNEIERMIGTLMQQKFQTLISSEWDGSFSQEAIEVSKLFDYFANGHSEIPDRGQLSLLSLLQIQAEKFVNQFHEERKNRVEAALDIEQWKVVEVPRDFQRLISMIVDEQVRICDLFSRDNLQQLPSLSKSGSNASMTSLVANNGTRGSAASSRFALGNNNNDSLVNDKDPSSISSLAKNRLKVTSSMYVEVDGSEFVIVNSVINLIRTIMDYCKCVIDIKSLSADLLERLFKILQMYNSKTYHLVYSAGATNSSGVKAITTRSLIVSQRSLKLIMLIIPAIHQHFSMLLPKDKRLRRFNEIKSLYEEHVIKIPERVISIVRDIIDLQLHEWDAKPPVPSTQFNSVAQHFIRLHDNIQDTLPDGELVSLFGKISVTFKEVLIKHLRRLNISNDSGPRQWLVMQELTFYRISLSKLKAFQAIELNLGDIWTNLEPQEEEQAEEGSDKIDDNGILRSS